MLKCKGYKMFKGSATIKPVTKMQPFTVTGMWLYKPEYDCWYCNGSSYPAKIVTDIKEDAA